MNLMRRLFGPKETPLRCGAVVVAAGSSARMEGTDKIMAELDGTPVICRTLAALEQCPLLHEIVVVTREELIVPVGQLCQDYGFRKVTKVVVGGSTRPESVVRGMDELSRDAALIAIHDGARPFVSQALLEEVISAAARCNAAAPAVPVKDTIKQADRGRVTGTPDRNTLFAVQTPQVFEASLIRAALHQALEEGAALTDDCSAVERLGMTVCLTAGSDRNIKLTTPTDLLLGEALARQERE
jgi:2-C-methyl-D-erythritol 4-phosphate cytidylyltransferase